MAHGFVFYYLMPNEWVVDAVVLTYYFSQLFTAFALHRGLHNMILFLSRLKEDDSKSTGG